MSFQPPLPWNRRAVFLASIAILILVRGSAVPQNQPPAAGDLINHLNKSLVWYRQLAEQQEVVSEPSDLLFVNDNRQIANQVVRLSFDFARADARLQISQSNTQNPANTDQSGPPTQYQRLSSLAAKADQQVKTSQQELDSLQRQLETATGKRRRTLQAAIAETQAELDLFQARRDSIRNMLQFVSGADAGGGGLLAQIDELARTVPQQLSADNAGSNEKAGARSPAGTLPAGSTPDAAATTHKAEPAGILGLISESFALHRKHEVLEDSLEMTDSLAQSAKSLRTPLGASIRDLTTRTDQLASQPALQQDPQALAEQRKQVDAFTTQFKQLSSALLPLGKEIVLLDLYRRSLTNWQADVDSHYRSALRNLAVRLALLAFVIAIVISVSGLWRRAISRYVSDVRRRYQFNLLRRIVMWFVVAIIITIAFATELGTITTFAGLLTAGVAVALQNVILSVAGYFFLIGKYGVRVGDRIQIAGVTGDVVDIGLIRLHLMEVSTSAGSKPTGRVVVFSNAVVFQPNAGLFKQIPGTNFNWHEITLNLAASSDYREVENRMLEAVHKVYADYKERMEIQRRSMERTMNAVSISSLAPESRVRLTPTGIEVTIRYPVELSTGPEIDDRITRELLNAIEREPRLQLVGSSTPKPHPAVSETAEKAS